MALGIGKNSGLVPQLFGLHEQGLHMTDQSNTAETDSGIILLSHARDILSKQPEGYLWENTK